VYCWRASRDPKTLLERHRVSPGFGHALLSPIAAFAFESLGVSANVWEHGYEWMNLHDEPSTIRSEYAHNLATQRRDYNGRMLSRVLATKRPVRGERSGFSDLFVPIVCEGRVVGVLVVGPYATAHATATDVLGRWRVLTGRQGHPSDPAFADYLSLTLGTLVLDGDRAALFERLVGCIAKLMVADGPADALANEAERLRVALEGARYFERVSRAVHEMVDGRTAVIWQGDVYKANRSRLGLARPADAALVGLAVSARRSADPVDDAIRRHRFQRRLVERMREAGDAIAGPIGNHGVVIVSCRAGSTVVRRQRLADLGARASDLARVEFGLVLHVGVAASSRQQILCRTYEEALGAAEAALSHDEPLRFAEPGEQASRPSLRHLRRELGRAVLDQPAVLTARFDRYLEAVEVECSYLVTAARGQLDAGFERIAEPLVGRGTLDPRTFDALCRALDQSARDASTLGELFDAYRTAVSDVAEAVQHPAAAQKEQSLRRAVEHMHRHYAEPLTSSAMAKMAGFTRTHFSKLFKDREKKTFVAYVTGLRVERAKELLDGTDLAVARVAEQSGFRSVQYFCRVFRHLTGLTPEGHRARSVGRHKRATRN
jgi:AraC-like DNA-binding protein